MIIEKPACDWLTLTTHVGLESVRLFNAVARYGKDGKEGRVMQYEGRRWDCGFFGSAVQKGRKHYMMRASGDNADSVLRELSENCPARCTRIDLQITIPMKPEYSARRTCDMLRGTKWPGRDRKTMLIENADGLDTLYIGSRLSETFTRLYVKEGDGQRYLRYEVEFKGDTAEMVYGHACVGREMAMGGTLLGEIEKLPEIADSGLSEVHHALANFKVVPRKGYRVRDPHTTMLWIQRSVSPAIVRLLRDHDQGDQVARFVKEWYEMADELGRV
jgi:hypothetical protein